MKAIGERDHEVFHDAVEPTGGDEPRVAGEATENENAPAADQNAEDQDPMEVLGYVDSTQPFVKLIHGLKVGLYIGKYHRNNIPENAEVDCPLCCL